MDHRLPDTWFARQLTLLPPNETPITIIGAGGIGSVTAFCLAKIGCLTLKVFDDDTVENENIPSQLFSPLQVGVPKAVAINETISDFIGMDIDYRVAKWDGTPSTIVISAVDSMTARKEIWEQLKQQYGVALYIDARMGGEKMRLFSCTPTDPDHQKAYETTLYSDEQAGEEECTAKAIAYNTFVIGGLVASMVKHFLKKEPVPREIIFNLSDYSYLKT